MNSNRLRRAHFSGKELILYGLVLLFGVIAGIIDLILVFTSLLEPIGAILITIVIGAITDDYWR